jgi:hypothetical protein
MNSEPQWLSTNFAPEMIDLMPIKVFDKNAGEVKALLHIEGLNAKGQVVISTSYNKSPFVDIVLPCRFYLTQGQLDDFHNKGAMCVLIAPSKDENG